jgi:multidrug resistance efflux pump
MADYEKEKSTNTSVELKEKDYAYAQEVLNRAKEDFERKQSLYDASSASKFELDTEKRKYEDAEKSANDKKLMLDDAKKTKQQTLDKLQSGINQQKTKLEDLKLSNSIQHQKLETLESDIRILKDKLNKSYIRENKIVSDVKNGIVQEITRVSGDYIQANTKIFSLVNMDSLVVEADVSEDFIKDVKIGAEVEIMPIADSNKIYKGRVLKIADMGVEKNGETFITTQISIDNPDEYIKPNFNVDVKISK